MFRIESSTPPQREAFTSGISRRPAIQHRSCEQNQGNLHSASKMEAADHMSNPWPLSFSWRPLFDFLLQRSWSWARPSNLLNELHAARGAACWKCVLWGLNDFTNVMVSYSHIATLHNYHGSIYLHYTHDTRHHLGLCIRSSGLPPLLTESGVICYHPLQTRAAALRPGFKRDGFQHCSRHRPVLPCSSPCVMHLVPVCSERSEHANRRR